MTTQQAVEKTKERIRKILTDTDFESPYEYLRCIDQLSSLIDEEKRGVAVDALSTMGRIDRAIGTSNKFIKTGGRREMVRNMREFAEKWIPLKALITNSQEK